MDDVMSTPVKRITRENLPVLIANNIVNNSVEFNSDCDTMGLDSPVRKPSRPPICKKLFHSPMADRTNQVTPTRPTSKPNRKAQRRKQILIPDNNEKIKIVFVKVCDRDGYSADDRVGIGKKVLISLFHNKEYCMEFAS